MISYHSYCSLKEQICRNANLPLSVSITEWRELMFRHYGEAGENLGSLGNPLFVDWGVVLSTTSRSCGQRPAEG